MAAIFSLIGVEGLKPKFMAYKVVNLFKFLQGPDLFQKSSNNASSMCRICDTSTFIKVSSMGLKVYLRKLLS